MKRVFVTITGLIGLTGATHAQTPVAVVEDVQGKVSGVEFMDYVMPGKIIKLGADGRVVLGYMKSCWRETITGIGTVIVGTEQSAVHLADFQAGKVACDSSQSQVVPREVGESAATLVRSISEAPVPTPALTLHGVSPIIEAADRGKLLIERLDLKGERHEVDLARAAMTRGRFYDLAKANVALKPGGTYAATLGSKQIIFLVDTRADAGASPIVGRLLRLR
jgi:hypothetical protein